MQALEKRFLYLVVLGGKANKANVELHDVRWVVGSKIEDTYDALRKDWFGALEGLHIASLEMLISCDNCQLIKKIDKWEIELIPQDNIVEETNCPDWYGYKRIDCI